MIRPNPGRHGANAMLAVVHHVHAVPAVAGRIGKDRHGLDLGVENELLQ